MVVKVTFLVSTIHFLIWLAAVNDHQKTRQRKMYPLAVELPQTELRKRTPALFPDHIKSSLFWTCHLLLLQLVQSGSKLLKPAKNEFT